MKKVVTMLLAGVVLSAVGLNSFTAQKEPVEVVTIGGDLSSSYQTVDELSTDSPVIVGVKAKDVDSFTFEGTVFTLTEAEIEKVYKGDLQKHDTIRILETGGIDDGKSYAFEGNEVFKKNEKAIVFLKPYDGPVAQNAYVVSGVYQGKFKQNQLVRKDPPMEYHRGSFS